MAILMIAMMSVMSISAFAAGDVAGAIEGTWTTASTQIKTVVNNVVFPIIDVILAVFFFAKLGLAYFDYRLFSVYSDRADVCLDDHKYLISRK